MNIVEIWMTDPEGFHVKLYSEDPKISLLVCGDGCSVEVNMSYLVVCSLLLKLEEAKKGWETLHRKET